ncbi:MAG: FAD-binding oxidoreductase [Acidimicrobiales bacterium]|nr:FAD-binding oxidoreductase [Acidimicrobiales bacterium]
MVEFADDFSGDPWWWRHAPPAERSTPPPDWADVVVIGAGYAGLCCAMAVAEAGRSVVVVDSLRVGEGAAGRNAGLCSGRAGISKMIDLEGYVGHGKAAAILDEADEAFAYFRSMAQEVAPGAYEHRGRFVAARTPSAFANLAKKFQEYKSASVDGVPTAGFELIDASGVGRFVASDVFHGGMSVEDAGLVHPARYVHGLLTRAELLGVAVHTGVRVTGIDSVGPDRSVLVKTADGDRTIRATEIVLATNGYTDSSAPWHRARIVPMSSTIIATETLGRERVEALLPAMTTVIDTNRVIVYARPTPGGEGILFGGRAKFHPVGPDTAASVLYNQMMKVFPSLAGVKVTNAWSGYMAFTKDWLPKIGQHDGLYYALGCNGGSGVVLMSWLGRKIGQQAVGDEAGRSSLEDIAFRRQPLGRWTSVGVPLAGIWYRTRDAIDSRR